MDYEKMERTMEFILDQMANMTIKQAKIDEQLAILTADAVTADQEWEKLRDEIREVKEVAIAHNQAISRLLKAQEESMKLHEQHRTSSAENAAMIKEIGQRIDNLRQIVEMQTRASHNGES